MRKIVFLDVDGTLVDFNQQIPDSTKEALIKARGNGHYLVLCTGRISTGIYPWLLEYFDGIVASAGAHILWNNEELFHSYIEKEDLFKIAEVVEKNGGCYIIQGSSGRYVDKKNNDRVIEFYKALGREDILEVLEHSVIEKPWEKEDVETLVYNGSSVGVEQMQLEIGSNVKVTAASFGEDRIHNGEITKNGVNKATGMERLIKHLGMKKEDTIAFGDGPNDFEMIEYAEIGVAMGNAVEELKSLANMITDDILDNGIYNGFKKLGLI